MAKKVTFLLVMVFVLLIASVTAFAAGTDSTTPKSGFTEDKARLKETVPEVSVSDLEVKYGEIFFGNVKSSKEIVFIQCDNREYGHELRRLFTGQATDSVTDNNNPVIMLMYIKVDGVYVPLIDVNTRTNMTQELCYLKTVVDLKYLGTNKVNEVRAIAFRKNNVDKLALDENLQITDLSITFGPWDPIKKVTNFLKDVFN